MSIVKIHFLTLIAIIILSVFNSSISYSKVYIDINSPTLIQTPIAVTEFKDMSLPENRSQEIAKDLREVMISDLNFSGLFDVIEKTAYIEDPLRAGLKAKEIDFADWRQIGSELLIKGGYTINPSTKKCKKGLKVEINLFDVIREQLIAGRWYCSDQEQLRRIIHKFSNRIIKELTGEKGVFESRLAFATHTADNKDIYYSDYDGYGKVKVTNGSINNSPQWSPDGRWLLYTSLRGRQHKLYVKNTFTGKEINISNETVIGPRWSPLGNEIALTISSLHGNSELYIMNISTRKLTRLTNNSRIDVSPTWSPDGKRIAFVSDRAGKTHIYSLESDGANIKRLTYKGKNESPAWSPRGDKIAFSRSINGNFNIWVMNPDGTEQRQLTFDSDDDEHPSWASNGRYIAFKSDRDGSSAIYIMRADGTNLFKVTKGSNPSWSP